MGAFSKIWSAVGYITDIGLFIASVVSIVKILTKFEDMLDVVVNNPIEVVEHYDFWGPVQIIYLNSTHDFNKVDSTVSYFSLEYMSIGNNSVQELIDTRRVLFWLYVSAASLVLLFQGCVKCARASVDDDDDEVKSSLQQSSYNLKSASTTYQTAICSLFLITSVDQEYYLLNYIPGWGILFITIYNVLLIIGSMYMAKKIQKDEDSSIIAIIMICCCCAGCAVFILPAFGYGVINFQFQIQFKNLYDNNLPDAEFLDILSLVSGIGITQFILCFVDIIFDACFSACDI